MDDLRFELLEKYVSEALSDNYKVNSHPITIYSDSDPSDFIMYFATSNNAADGSNLFDGWTAFAFISNRPLVESTKGERIMGRRIILPKNKKYNDIIRSLKGNVESGKYNGIFDSKTDDIPFVFDSTIFPGTWAVHTDTRSKTGLIWLVRKK